MNPYSSSKACVNCHSKSSSLLKNPFLSAPLLKQALYLGVMAVMLSACSAQKSDTMGEPTSSKSVSRGQSSEVASEVANADMAAPMVEYSTAEVVSAPPYYEPTIESRDNYQKNIANPIQRTLDNPVATLSIDTDTGSYANIRRYLNEGSLPPSDAVRVEEMINYFNYDFANSKRLGRAPFVVETELVSSPWNASNQGNQILKVGIKAVDSLSFTKKIPPSNLVFLVDVSGSMDEPDKLPLAKSALNLLSKQLRAEDTISIISYSGETEVVLPATRGNDTRKIQAAINSLQAEGSTNGEDALKLAYNEAQKSLKKNGINRILMLTDGDFNVGISSVEEMLDLVKANRSRGISLSTVGFGRGNLNDFMMEQMADSGNGNYSYIDSLMEAKKVFSDELASTFNTVASDVKIQLEFNPDAVSEWRLIGYENRLLNEADFSNDKVDAGEIGAGKSVVALFEVTPKGQKGSFEPRRYAKPQVLNPAVKAKPSELGFLKVRYKLTPEARSQLVELPILANNGVAISRAHPDTQFAIAVAGFGQKLQGSDYINNWKFSDSKRLANQSLSAQSATDLSGLRRNFVQLLDLAEALSPTDAAANR